MAQISKHLGIHPIYGYELKKKLIDKYGCTTQPLLKKGKRVIHKVLDDYLSDKTKRAGDALRVVERSKRVSTRPRLKRSVPHTSF